jgi:hypothetical protein
MAAPTKALKNFLVEVNANPNIPPKEKNYNFNRPGFNCALSSYDEKYAPALSTTADSIRRVSFNDFIASLGHCVNRLPKNLLSHATVLVSEGKSNKWVAEIALKYFPQNFIRNVTTFLSLGHEEGTEFVKTLGLIPAKNWPKDLVLFDDAGFSGNQMSKHVTAIINKMSAEKGERNIYIVVPFVTNVALTVLNSIILPKNIKLHIITDTVVPTVRETLSEENFDALNELCGEVLTKGNEKETGQKEDSGIAFTYFDHKIPNNQSFIFSVIARETMPNVKPPYIN